MMYESLRALFSLAGINGVVTGAGSGIGRAIAQMLARAGAAITCADIDLDAALSTVSSIMADGGNARAARVDVSDEASIMALYEEIGAQVGAIDLLVNNAGIFPKLDFLSIDAATWDRVQNVNLRGAYFCMREAIKQMRASGRGGNIINISSVTAIHPGICDNSHYGASKAGVLAITRSVALEFAADNIRCNAILPGGVNTEGARAHSAKGGVRGPMTTPGRFLLPLCEPEDIAAAALFLASPASRCMTGQTIVADSGFLVT